MMALKCKWLVLVPTELERQSLVLEGSREVQVELCGFGPIVAAARTARFIEFYRPAGILLCGIAGAYTADLPIGEAFQFRKVACYGIGTGSGNSFLTH